MKCIECKTKIEPPKKSFCSSRCGYAYWTKKRSVVNKKPRNCENCGHEFTPVKNVQRFCSIECHDSFKYTKTKVYKPIKCTYCKELFTPVNKFNKLCSKECRSKNSLEKRSKKQSKTIKCKHCGIEFQPYTSLTKFCSSKCRINDQKSKRSKNWDSKKAEAITGKNNPAYRNGRYTRTSNKLTKGNALFRKRAKKLRERLIEESGFIHCEHCKRSDKAKYETHHIIYRSEKPGHQHIHDSSNLILLCVQCHNEFHKQKGMRDDLVEKRELFKLFGNDVRQKSNQL